MTKEEKQIKTLALKNIRQSCYGNYVPTKESEDKLDKIYKEVVLSKLSQN